MHGSNYWCSSSELQIRILIGPPSNASLWPHYVGDRSAITGLKLMTSRIVRPVMQRLESDSSISDGAMAIVGTLFEHC